MHNVLFSSVTSLKKGCISRLVSPYDNECRTWDPTHTLEERTLGPLGAIQPAGYSCECTNGHSSVMQCFLKISYTGSPHRVYRKNPRQNNLVVEHFHWKLLRTAVPNESAYSHNSLLRSNPLYNCSRHWRSGWFICRGSDELILFSGSGVHVG